MWQRFKNSTDWRYLGLVIPFMLLLQLIGPEALRYRHDWVASGEIWRILSAHWIHVGWTHWLLNSAGLIVLVSLTMPGWSIVRWIVNTVVLALGISFCMTWYSPEVDNFAGHSGVLYGLYILGAVNLFRRDRLVALLVGGAILTKILMEQFEFYDFNSGGLIGARVIVDSHLYGTVVAFAIALVQFAVTMNHGTSEQSN